LSGVDSNSFGNISQALSGDTGGLFNKGIGALSSLFGNSLLNNFSGAIGKYAGLDPGIVQKLLAFLAPIVMGKVAGQWKSQGGTPSALSNLLTEQMRYVPDSLPPGFSLDQVPGLSGATDAAHLASQTTRRAAETAGRAAPSMASWLLPIAALAVVGLLLWNMMKSRPDATPVASQETSTEAEEVTVMRPNVPDTTSIPSVSDATGQIKTMFNDLTETFTRIKDAASAEAQLPQLEQLSTKIDSMKSTLRQMPLTGRATLQDVVDKAIEPVKAQIKQTLSLPGLSDRVHQLIAQILRKLEEWKLVETTG
jgi:hypothetical protein